MELYEKWVKRLCWIPFVVGFAGYLICFRMPVFEAIYAAVALYFVNPITEDTNGIILLAELSAVLVTASVLFSILRSLQAEFRHFLCRHFSDSTAVYADNEIGREIIKTVRHGYVSDRQDGLMEKTCEHIIALSDDVESLQLYNENKGKLRDKKVYILLNQLDSSLLGAFKDPGEVNLHFINIYEVLAREYWRQNSLYDSRNQETVRIAIVGFGKVGRAIFKYGYMNNLYKKEQKFEYHIWGADPSDVRFLSRLPTANRDSITMHTEDPKERLEEIAAMTRVILADGYDNLNLMQGILYRNNLVHLHCYFEEDPQLDYFLKNRNLVIFGDFEDILTEKNIKGETLYRMAKLLNYDYALRSAETKCPDDFEDKMEAEWRSLDGFKKGSNIARADHYWIELRLREDEPNLSEEYFWEIEHMRWCRYHYIHHWVFNEKRNDAIRHHHLLIPYEKLQKEEQKKDGIHDDIMRREIDKCLEQENEKQKQAAV